MKIKTVESKNVFQPIVMEITIESEEELKFLWHLSNSPVKKIKTDMCSSVADFDYESVKDAHLSLFKTLDLIAIQKGLTK
jgi:hypothetical protein